MVQDFVKITSDFRTWKIAKRKMISGQVYEFISFLEKRNKN